MNDAEVAKNTDTKLFEEIEGDFYSPCCFMTEGRALGINVGGYVIVKTLKEWHQAIERRE